MVDTFLIETLDSADPDDVCPDQAGVEETIRTFVASVPKDAQSNSYINHGLHAVPPVRKCRMSQ